MGAQIGICEGCGKPVHIGEPFDLDLLKWSPDFPADKEGKRIRIWHRACNPNADHSKDGE